MGSVNKVVLIGNLGRDAEVRYTAGGAAVTSLNLATTEAWKDKHGQRQEKTEWHRVVLWGKQAESLQEYLKKGKQLYVEGRLQTREYEKDGQKRYTTEIKADHVVLLGDSVPSMGDDGVPSRPELASASVGGRSSRGGSARARHVEEDIDPPF